MFHYFVWKIQDISGQKIIINDFCGLQINYLGTKNEWALFLYPFLDDNKKTIFYYAFDTFDQKLLFENTLKINGIWTKTAFNIVQRPREELQTAINNLDATYFQSLPGVGPKSSKKILLALKGNFEIDDLEKITIDEKLYRNILNSLKTLGYDVSQIKFAIKNYQGNLAQDELSDILKKLIKSLSK